jgi:hypothetical protein
MTDMGDEFLPADLLRLRFAASDDLGFTTLPATVRLEETIAEHPVPLPTMPASVDCGVGDDGGDG